MKYIVHINLKKSELIEVVYAGAPGDACKVAEANVSNLIETWEDSIQNTVPISYAELGEMACNCSPIIEYKHGSYVYCGRNVEDSTDFQSGFTHAYKTNQVRNNEG